MRKNHPLLRTIYIGTDTPLPELRHWLLSDGWDQVIVGPSQVWDGQADWELGEAVDMEIARRAGVFVGNGVSSYST